MTYLLLVVSGQFFLVAEWHKLTYLNVLTCRKTAIKSIFIYCSSCNCIMCKWSSVGHLNHQSRFFLVAKQPKLTNHVWTSCMRYGTLVYLLVSLYFCRLQQMTVCQLSKITLKMESSMIMLSMTSPNSLLTKSHTVSLIFQLSFLTWKINSYQLIVFCYFWLQTSFSVTLIQIIKYFHKSGSE